MDLTRQILCGIAFLGMGILAIDDLAMSVSMYGPSPAYKWPVVRALCLLGAGVALLLIP